MSRRRLGVVILFPADVCAEIDALRRALGDPAIDRIVPHLTLVPPVNVRDDDLSAALDVMRAAAGATAPFEMTLGPPATFLPVNPVLYLAVSSGAEHVQRLRDAVFTPPLERQLTWPFVPHVTIADDAEPARIEAALVALADFEATVPVERIAILEEGEGRTWDVLADAELAPRRIVGRGGLEVDLSVGEQLDPDAAAFTDRAWWSFDRKRAGDDLMAPTERPLAIAARRNGRVVGAADGYTRGDHGHISRLMVDESARGEGIGAHLLNAFQALAAERGCTTLTLRTDDGGGAQRFYERHGWVVTGRIPAYRRGIDFVQMSRTLR